MKTKKLCSIGILDIEFNLTLNNSFAIENDFDINKYNKVEDLEELFFSQQKNNNINYLEYISLSSKNNLINTLLCINRANNAKTFIEFIMPNELEFSENTKFIHKLLFGICNKNFLFILESKIIDVDSNIKFNIKIIDDDTNEVMESKIFNLFEINNVEESICSYQDKNNPNRYMKVEIDYNFEGVDYFLIDLYSFKNDLKWQNNRDMITFLTEILNKNKKIKIILIINDDCFIGYKLSSLLEIYKEIIELSDIIFSNKENLNYFLKTYNFMKYSLYSNNSNLKNCYNTRNSTNSIFKMKMPSSILAVNNAKNFDYIITDNNKHRKTIPRLSIIFDKAFNSLTIYNQIGAKMDLNYNETYYFKIKPNNIISKNNYFYSYIGGFLSRYLFNKSYHVCFYAGCLLIKKIYKYYKNGINITNIDDYNILVPNKSSGSKNKITQMNNKLLEEKKKEKGFVLDCTNMNSCKIQTYNSLYDKNCASYLLKKTNLRLLHKNGFINRKGLILRNPSLSLKFKKYYTSKKSLKINLINLNCNDNISDEYRENDITKIKFKTISSFRHSNKINKNKNKYLPLLSNNINNYKLLTSRENKNIKNKKENYYYKYLFGIYKTESKSKFSDFLKKQ